MTHWHNIYFQVDGIWLTELVVTVPAARSIIVKKIKTSLTMEPHTKALSSSC